MPSTATPALDVTSGRKESAVQRPQPENSGRNATDDEILGLMAEAGIDSTTAAERDARADREFDSGEPGSAKVVEGPRGREDGADTGKTEAHADANADADADPAKLRAAFEANPELRQAWEDAKEYRQAFATPQEARHATALLADLNRMDALFYSQRPEDHAELARSIAALDPAAFASLAKAIGEQASRQQTTPAGSSSNAATASAPSQRQDGAAAPAAAGISPSQAEFFQAANAAAVQGVLDAIETQVERLLPEGASKSARNRVVGEIYRELDSALGANRQLSQQVREAFRSGALDASHQRAIVSLITGRARQALPGVAKRVMNEWTSTIVAANQDRRARQHAAERRVDIAGSSGGAGEGRRSMAPRDIDYARMSDGDILNL